MNTDCTLTKEEIAALEAERFDTFDEAELNANDLANDGCEGIVVRIRGGKFAVQIVRK